MASYTDRQSVLDVALGKFKNHGFSLIEPDDHLLELYFKEKKIATYYQSAVTFKSILEGCQNFLKNIEREQ